MTYSERIIQLYNLPETQYFGFSENEIIELETRLGISLPQKVRNYYLTLGKYKHLNYAHNRLLKPNKEIGFSNDGALIFYEENQVVVYWGIKKEDLKLDNPPVWGNYGTDELPDWHLEAKTVEGFFLLMAIYNGTLGGLKYHANSFELVKTETIRKIKNNWTELIDISSGRQKVFTDNFHEVLSLSFDEKENCTAIFVGTSQQDRFDNILNNLDIHWSYTSYEDDD